MAKYPAAPKHKYKLVIARNESASTFRNLLLSLIDPSSASVMLKPSKQNTATPPANAIPPRLVTAFLPDVPSNTCKSAFTTTTIASTLHKSAKALKGAKAERDQMRERAISTGTRRKMKVEKGRLWDLKIEERFWSMKTR
ncbi:hypothetical protein ACLOJK_037767 [Asimina triloba]